MKSIYILPIIIIALVACNKSEPVLVHGCTDPTAINYDPSATSEDNSCIFPGDTVTFAVDLVVVEFWNTHYDSPITRVEIINFDNNSSQVGDDIITTDYSSAATIGERLKVNTNYRINVYANDNNGLPLTYSQIRIEEFNGGYVANEIAGYSYQNSSGNSLGSVSVMENSGGFRIRVNV